MKMRDKIINRTKVLIVMLGAFFTYFLIALSAVFWMDLLWMLGVEDSQRYTWWGFIYAIAHGGW